MTEEELAALKLKYEGKLARLTLRGVAYDNNAEGVVKEIKVFREGYRAAQGGPWVIFDTSPSVYFFDRDGFELELHPDQTGVRNDS